MLKILDGKFGLCCRGAGEHSLFLRPLGKIKKEQAIIDFFNRPKQI